MHIFMAAGDLNWSKSMLQGLVEKAVAKITEYGAKILFAILFLVIAFKIINWFIRFLRKSFKKHELEPSVAGFLLSLIRISLKVLACLTSISIMGIQITSFITVLGSAGIAVGLALQGSLANFAGGALILILKPYKVGDYIIAENNEGTVVSIDIFYTKLLTFDNQSVVIPNGILSNTSLVNVTREDYRRIDLDINVAYKTNLEIAKNVLQEAVSVIVQPIEGFDNKIFVKDLADSSICIAVKAWVPTEEYWGIRGDLIEKIKMNLDQAGIEIPFNTLDVNVVSHN